MKNQFKYTGSEALDMVKAHFPKTWETEIETGKKMIRSLMKIYKASPLEAYARFSRTGAAVPNQIINLAALHCIIEEEKNVEKSTSARIIEIQEQQQNCINQSLAMETSRSIEELDKRMLREFYSKKQEILRIELEQITNSIEVKYAFYVVVQTNLFAN